MTLRVCLHSWLGCTKIMVYSYIFTARPLGAKAVTRVVAGITVHTALVPIKTGHIQVDGAKLQLCAIQTFVTCGIKGLT